MIVLAIDTAGREGSVALVEAGHGRFAVLGLAPLAGGVYSARLIPAIATLLEAAGVDKGAIDLLAVNSGPGSFTGLRVGLSTAKGLAESLGKPIVAISALEALAIAVQLALRQEGLSHNRRVIAALDAQRQEVYAGDYEVSSEAVDEASLQQGVPLRAECIFEKLVPLADFVAEVSGGTSPATVCTPDAAIERALRMAGVSVELVARPRADLLARIGVDRFYRGATVTPEALDANYLRRSDAEIFSTPNRNAASKRTSPGGAADPDSKPR